MSLARVRHIAISLDGFAIGEGQSLDAPFGHAGERLHEWLFETPWGREMLASSAVRRASTTSSYGCSLPGSAPRSWVQGSSVTPDGHEDPEWKGWWGPNPPSTHRSSSSPITRHRGGGISRRAISSQAR